MSLYPLCFLTYSHLYACSSFYFVPAPFLVPFSQNASYSCLKTQFKCHFLQEIFPDPPRLLRRPLPTIIATSSTGHVFNGSTNKNFVCFLVKVQSLCLLPLHPTFSTCNEYLLNVYIQKRKINLTFPQDSADEKQIVVMKHFKTVHILCFTLLRVFRFAKDYSVSVFLSCLSYIKSKASHIPTVLKSFGKHVRGYAIIFPMKYYIPQI